MTTRGTDGRPDGRGEGSDSIGPVERYTHRIEVRYGETDQMGVVHHANYLLYLEEARTAFMRASAVPYGDVERSGVGLPVRSVALRYRNPALYEDTLRVDVWIEAVRAASLTFGYEVTCEHRGGGQVVDGPLLIATASVELACIDLDSKRPRTFPDQLARFLGEHGS